MATWFIRLGNNPELAKKHEIITIGYNINENITKINNLKEMNKKLTEMLGNQNIEATPQQIYVRAGLINDFVNKIKIGDTIISPLNNGYKIGEVVSECDIVESFFKGKKALANALGKYSNDKKDPQEIKPAIKVDWVTGEVRRSEFPQEIGEALKKSMPKTVNRLNLDDSTEFALEKFVQAKREIEKERKINRDWKWKATLLALGTSSLTAIVSAFATVFATRIADFLGW